MLPSASSLLTRAARALPRDLADRLALARRDLKMVLDGIAGRTPSPVIRVRAVTRASASALGVRRGRVIEVVHETPDAVSLLIEDLSGAPFRYEAGQFFTLCAHVDGAPLRRAYSASRPPSPDGVLRLTVKRVADGAVSTWVTTKLRAGDTVELLGPSGTFVVSDPTAAQRVVLIGGGSGVTPLFAIASALLSIEGGAEVALLYGNRSRRDTIFAEALDALAAAHPARFTLLHALERAHDGFDGLVGALDELAVTALLDALPATERATSYFLCGPTPMREGARSALLARGVEPAQIHEEVYASPRRPASSAGGDAVVTLKLPGRSRSLEVRDGETILDAALREGIDMPYSCAMGGCGACKCQRVAGEVVMEEPNCLGDDEREAGAVLTCVGRPVGPGVVIEVP